MFKNAKCPDLTNLLKRIYCDIINEGIILNNFNASIITPIEKKDIGNINPKDFRPISVSNVFCNLHEMIILLFIKLHRYLNSVKNSLVIRQNLL